MLTNVVMIAYSFCLGGASIAANKFKQLLSDNVSSFKVDSISQDNASQFQFFKRLVSYALAKLQYDDNPIKHSLNFFSYAPIVESFKMQSQSIHHLHWVNNDTLSVFDFDKIPTGSVITLHDEWLYCGSEHSYKVLDSTDDFIKGYTFLKKGVYGLHWNYLIWRIKKSKLSHRTDLIYTVPSLWMLKRAKSSLILKKTDVRYLPNPIDTELFKPASVKKIEAFKAINLINETAVAIAFGAIGGKKNYLKGAHLLDEALVILQSRLSQDFAKNIKLIDFGGALSEGVLHGFRSISIGHIHDPRQLALLYSSVDCVVVPSMVESFGQVAAESLSCSTPVVCFDTSGLRDIVINQQTGLVAKAFEPESLADQLLTIIEMSSQARKVMGQKGRAYVVSKFSYPVVSKQYLNILQDAARIKQRMIE